MLELCPNELHTVELGAVGNIENQLETKLLGLLLYFDRPVDGSVVPKDADTLAKFISDLSHELDCVLHEGVSSLVNAHLLTPFPMN